MDPITAFSLVCGIIQLVDFSSEVMKKCRELYKDGASSENKDLEEMATHLTSLCTNLDLTTQEDMEELLDLGSKCSQTAQELAAALQKLKVDGPQRKRQVFGKAIKAIGMKNALKDIQKRLGDYQKLLDSRILVDLRFVHHHCLHLFLEGSPLLCLTCEDPSDNPNSFLAKFAFVWRHLGRVESVSYGYWLTQ